MRTEGGARLARCSRPRRSAPDRVLLRYDPPAGKLGAAVARLFGEDPDTQVADDLRRLKQLMEAGETAPLRG